MPKPPPPPKPKAPAKPKRPRGDFLARKLAGSVRATYGEGEASTLDMSEELGSPRGFIGMRNIGLERAIGGGLPLGRITEISGWEGAGKSTVADQILAQAQEEGGLGVLADTERARNRAYMRKLGIRDESLIRIGGMTIEAMFGEMELLMREYASVNAIAWHQALKRAGGNPPKMSEYTYEVTEGRGDKRKRIGKHRFTEWDRTQAAALLAFQQKHPDLKPSSIRDVATRALLRPVTIYTEATHDLAVKHETAAHLKDWELGHENPYCQPAGGLRVGFGRWYPDEARTGGVGRGCPSRLGCEGDPRQPPTPRPAD